ncbi:MAG: hypothetical protein ACFFDI_08670 [Promethearchaeota archaeon]
MLVEEFLLSFVGFILVFFATGVLIKHTKDSPINEMRLLSITFIMTDLFLLGLVLAALLHSPNTIHPLGIQCHRIGFVFGQLAILSGSFGVFFPSFRTNYRSIFVVVLLSVINTWSGIINALTLTHTITGEYIQIVYDSFGFGLFGFTMILFLSLIAIRILKTSLMSEGEHNPFTSQRSLIIIFLLITFTMIAFMFSRIFPDIPVPGFIGFFALSLMLTYFIYAFSRNKALFFITPAKLEAIIITRNESKLPLFTKTFNQDLDNEKLLGTFFAALEISLRAAVKTETGAEQFIFGDKVVLRAPGQWVTSLMIVSEWNFITSSIVRYLTRQFERLYKRMSSIENSFTSVSEFHEFEEVIKEIRQYLPL